MLLRIGEPVCSAQFARFVDVDREPTRHPFSADLEALDLRTAPRLALPGRGDAPVCLAFCGVPPGAFDQRKQVVKIDAVDDGRFGGLRLGNHDRPPLTRWMVRVRAGLLERGERRLDALALVFGYQAGKHLAEMRVLGARMDVLPAVGLEECGA